MTRRGGRDPDDARFRIRRGGAAAAAAGTADARLDVEEMVFGIHRGLAIGGAGR